MASLGVVGALYGGVISASVVLGKNLLSAVSSRGPSRIGNPMRRTDTTAVSRANGSK